MSSLILTAIQTQINNYGNPILTILGDIGNLFIVILFIRQHKNPCSVYLLSAAIMNICYLTFNRLVQTFPFYYGDESIGAFVLCKIRSYLPSVFGIIAKTMLILACIDRFLITNERASLRALSTSKRAKLLVIFFIIFWFLASSHIAIMTTIINKQCGTIGIYSIIYTIYTIIVIGLIPPITLGIFGYLTYRNMKRRHVRIQPIIHNTSNSNNSIQRRDRELLIAVIWEVIVYVITTALYPMIHLETLISKNIILNKSVLYTQIESFIFFLSFFLLSFNIAVPFYIYFISSKSFRREFKLLFINLYWKLKRQTFI